MKFVHYTLVNAVSQLRMDKNADTHVFAKHCFYHDTNRNEYAIVLQFGNLCCPGAQYSVIHSFILLECAEFDDSLLFSGASSIPLCYVLFPATHLHHLFFHPLSPHHAIYFMVYLSIFLFPNSYIIPFWEFYFLPFSVHAQTNIIYLTLLSLL